MKKTIITFTLSLVFCYAAIISAFATSEVMEYQDIPENIEVALKKNDDVEYIQVCSAFWLSAIYRKTPDEITEMYSKYYVSLKFGVPQYYYTYSDDWDSVFQKELPSYTKDFIKKSLDFDSIQMSLPDGAEITDCYLFDDSRNHGGLYCYYETTKGDFILFRQCLSENDSLYFVSKAEMDAISMEYEEYLKNNEEELIGAIDFEEHFELTQYKYTPYKTIIIVSISVSVLLISLIAFVVIRHIQKRKTKGI